MGHWKAMYFQIFMLELNGLKAIRYCILWDLMPLDLPAENYAIKQGIPSKISTAANIANFKRQLKETACLYNWTRNEQLIPITINGRSGFLLKCIKAGLAYQTDFPINWCPSCMTGLANEEVVVVACERCGTQVNKKNSPSMDSR